MALETYNTAKMRSCAESIRTEMNSNYNNSMNGMNQTVEHLKNNWQDETIRKFSQKYMEKVKPTTENLSKLMLEYANLLESSAEAMEKIHAQANIDLG